MTFDRFRPSSICAETSSSAPLVLSFYSLYSPVVYCSLQAIEVVGVCDRPAGSVTAPGRLRKPPIPCNLIYRLLMLNEPRRGRFNLHFVYLSISWRYRSSRLDFGTSDYLEAHYSTSFPTPCHNYYNSIRFPNLGFRINATCACCFFV